MKVEIVLVKFYGPSMFSRATKSQLDISNGIVKISMRLSWKQATFLQTLLINSEIEEIENDAGEVIKTIHRYK